MSSAARMNPIESGYSKGRHRRLSSPMPLARGRRAHLLAFAGVHGPRQSGSPPTAAIRINSPAEEAPMCPQCRQPMLVFELDGVEIDRCLSCRGTWLDAGELEQIARLEGGSPERLGLAL